MTAPSADDGRGTRATPRTRSASSALEGMSAARRPTGPVVAVVVTLLIMGLGQLPAAPLALLLPADSFGGQMLLTVSFVLPMLLVFAWVRFKEKRPVASLGFRGRAGRHVLIGAVLAVVMISATVGLNVVLGTASLGAPTWAMLPLALVMLVGFAIQSSTEEIAIRGYLMQALSPRWGLVAAMVVQTLVFMLLHGANGGLTWVAWCNLAGLALFTGLWVWATGSLWGACAFHTFWNWSQGNLWGTSVSNVQVSASVGDFVPSAGSPAGLTGGTFGLEGSVVLLVLVTLGSLVLLLVGRRRRAPTGRVRTH